MIALLLLLQVLTWPNPNDTPGETRGWTKARICATRWGLDRRHVTTTMRREVFARYGVAWAARGQYEVDHLIPRELGGADVVANLWPERWPDAKVKDQHEHYLHREVCAGRLALEIAQSAMAHWGK